MLLGNLIVEDRRLLNQDRRPIYKDMNISSMEGFKLKNFIIIPFNFIHRTKDVLCDNNSNVIKKLC